MNYFTNHLIGGHFSNLTDRLKRDGRILGFTITVFLINGWGILAHVLPLLLIVHKPLWQPTSSSLIIHTVCLPRCCRSSADLLHTHAFSQTEAWAAMIQTLHRVTAAVYQTVRTYIHQNSHLTVSDSIFCGVGRFQVKFA
ncbi:hypothetical protein BV898_03061 [Hypsibius exemplaris]|uniref:Uncharacterized protein n=1 Tax=Hypsibius exemplaris TaxID=2072580 RepID=A0A1W0X6Y2_HYPEX|nr:hypothetical protein BV898_03061 [Hypsibius exemplaris]